jgi:precorrin-6B methylase 2
MASDSGNIGGIALVHTVFGDFLMPGEGDLRAEVRETGGQARPGLAMLSSRLRAGDTVVDLGAGVGMLSIPLQRAVGSAGRVWCFEPDSAASALLRWNLAINGVDLLTRAVAGDAWPRLDDWCRTVEIERVEAIRVHGAPAAAALAQDGLETLEAHRPLVLVTRDSRIEPDAPGFEKLKRELRRLGYRFCSHAEAADDESDAVESPGATGLPAGPLTTSVLAVAGADPGGDCDG